jgi:hypothetical protein
LSKYLRNLRIYNQFNYNLRMKYPLILIFSFIKLVGFANGDSVAYSRDYEFKEGYYLTAEQFKSNSPILKTAIVSSYPKSQVDFMTQMLEQQFITYKAADGSEQKVETLSLWGYCQNRSIFINYKDDFHRFNVIGTLCHFTAPVYSAGSFHDPMNTYGINANDELHPFIFDTRSVKVTDFVIKEMEEVLKEDPELYNEFMKLKSRKKGDSLFIYLRKFNERHPFYLPKD